MELSSCGSFRFKAVSTKLCKKGRIARRGGDWLALAAARTALMKSFELFRGAVLLHFPFKYRGGLPPLSKNNAYMRILVLL